MVREIKRVWLSPDALEQDPHLSRDVIAREVQERPAPRRVDLAGRLEVPLESARHRAAHVRVEHEEVALGVQVERPEVEVRRTDDGDVVVGDGRLRVKDRRLVLEDPHAGFPERAVPPVPRVADDRDV